MPPSESHAFRAYRGRLAEIVPLDRETERALARRLHDGDRRAGDSLVVACLPFVVSIALEYRRWGLPLEDIVQQGNVGLLRAAIKFDTRKDCRLATYAAYWIRAEIREHVVRAYRVVRLGTTKGERRALRAFRLASNCDAATLAAISGLTPERAEMLLPILAAREASIDVATPGKGALVDALASSWPTPEDDAGRREAAERVRKAVRLALTELTDRERLIVRERLMADEPRTLQDLGAELGVSKERVRQLEERARTKLRARLDDVRDEAA
jgi:RNA polymerase sigma-32 factor